MERRATGAVVGLASGAGEFLGASARSNRGREAASA
jgi:hypothetical protein